MNAATASSEEVEGTAFADQPPAFQSFPQQESRGGRIGAPHQHHPSIASSSSNNVPSNNRRSLHGRPLPLRAPAGSTHSLGGSAFASFPPPSSASCPPSVSNAQFPPSASAFTFPPSPSSSSTRQAAAVASSAATSSVIVCDGSVPPPPPGTGAAATAAAPSLVGAAPGDTNRTVTPPPPSKKSKKSKAPTVSIPANSKKNTVQGLEFGKPPPKFQQCIHHGKFPNAKDKIVVHFQVPEQLQDVNSEHWDQPALLKELFKTLNGCNKKTKKPMWKKTNRCFPFCTLKEFNAPFDRLTFISLM